MAGQHNALRYYDDDENKPLATAATTGTLTDFTGTISSARNSGVRLTFVSANARKPFSSYLFVKRMSDIVLSAIALVLLTPLLLLIAALVKLTSPGPVFFGHKRVGLNRVPFRCWKFRTMVTDADKVLAAHPELHAEFQVAFKIKNDPRVTPLGVFLRRASLDELPQIMNVLLGNMSIIGPRPIVNAEICKYGEHAAKLFTVKPGIGGLWQASGRSDMDYTARVLLDMRYIDRRSFSYDLSLLVRTTEAVIRRRGAY